MMIEIGYHTDIRGSKTYNQQLAAYRLKSINRTLKLRHNLSTATNYILKAYGASYPIVKNHDLKNVSSIQLEEGLHELNERIELKILRIE